MARKKGKDIQGILLLDKPRGPSSNQALQQVRHLFDAKKAGHTGSLDPIATGLLPLCFGEATKVSQYLLEAPKRYLAGIRFGISTTTSDTEGEVVERVNCSITQSQVKHILPQFRGEIQQVPPMYSALKHQGQPLYKLARKGIEVDRPARSVCVYDARFISMEDNLLTLELTVSSGFYVRSLAHDMGQLLECGGHIESLQRTSVAGFDVKDAVTVQELQTMTESDRMNHLIAADKGITFLPPVELSVDAAYYLVQGQPVKAANAPDSGLVRLYDKGQHFIGIGQVLDDGRVAPKRLFAA